MNTTTHQLAQGRTIDQFLVALGEGGQYHLVRADHWQPGRHTLGSYRPVEPLKSLFFQPREFLGPTMAARPPAALPERIVIGVKNCDLAGLKIQDHIFGGLSPADPRFVEAREKTILVTCDCTDCLEVCFCPVVDEQPYAERGFDINISPLSQQYLIDVGSERGERLLEGLSSYLVPAEEGLLAERRERRSALYQRL
ncbi:MAG: hypothetical protein GTO03_09195, partial [Planctomycetales bacterium]|nr:hypothetical protein [Planctomycetales bacterium]